MKAAVVQSAGAAPVYADFVEPEPGEGQAVVELVAAGIHQVVRSRVAGRHYSTDGMWPAVPGVDAVARTPDGRLVYTGFVDPPWGTMAERMAVPAGFGTPVPAGADPLAVAAGMNPGLASWIPLARRRDELGAGRTGEGGDDAGGRGDRPGDDAAHGAASGEPPAGLGTVLVLGATGIAGGLAVDNAFALGADAVVAAGRDPDRLAALADRVAARALRTVRLDSDRLAALADRVTTPALRTVRLDPDRDRTADALADALTGQPPSTVIDFCWGPVADAAFHALGRPDLDTRNAGVRYVQVGGTAGPDATLPAALLRSRNITVTGSGLGGTPVREILTRLPEYLDLIAAGSVHVPYTAYPLSAVADAWSAADGTRAVVAPD